MKLPASPPWGGQATGRARVLVTGAGGNVAQGILKALAVSGLASRVVATDANPCSPGLFLVDKGYTVPRADDPAFEAAMVRILRDERIDITLVGADAETLHLARLADSLEAATGSRVLVCPPDVVARCHDKWLTSLWFRQEGLPHPKTVLASDEAGTDGLMKEFGFPLVVKPRTGFASRDVIIAGDRARLDAVRERFGETAVVQECVGDPSREYTATAFSVAPGQVRAVLVMRRELLQGTSVRVEPVRDPALGAAVRLWAERLGGLGPVNFQFRFTPRGPVCFEVNARFSGTMGVRYHFGYNDAAMAVRHFVLGEELAQPEILPGVVLRFWEELFIPGTTLGGMARQGCVPAGGPCGG
jgi:carbamoyl-phosphate synthase large subunit